MSNGLSAVVSQDPEHGIRLSVCQGDRTVFTLVGTLAARVNTLLRVEDEAMGIMEDVLSVLPEDWSEAEQDRFLAEELVEKVLDDDGTDLSGPQRDDLEQHRERLLARVDPAQLPPGLPAERVAEFEAWRSSLCALFLAHRATVHTMLDRYDWIFWLLRASGVSHARSFEDASDSEETGMGDDPGLLADDEDESGVFPDWLDASLDGELSPVLMTVAYPRAVTSDKDISLECDRFMQDLPEADRMNERLVPATLLSYLLFFDPARPYHPVALQYAWLEEGISVVRADMGQIQRTLEAEGARAVFSPMGKNQLVSVEGERATFRLAVADTLDAGSLPAVRSARVSKLSRFLH